MKKFLKWIGIGFAVLIGVPIIIAIVSIIANPSEYGNEPVLEMTQAQKDSVKISDLTGEIEKRNKYTWDASSVVAYYEKNEIKADEDLKGKYISVVGKITTVGKDIMGDPYIALGTQNFMRSVQFSFETTEGLSNLSVGDVITIRGKCDGLLGNVLFSDSELLPSMETLEKELRNLQSN